MKRSETSICIGRHIFDVPCYNVHNMIKKEWWADDSLIPIGTSRTLVSSSVFPVRVAIFTVPYLFFSNKLTYILTPSMHQKPLHIFRQDRAPPCRVDWCKCSGIVPQFFTKRYHIWFLKTLSAFSRSVCRRTGRQKRSSRILHSEITPTVVSWSYQLFCVLLMIMQKTLPQTLIFLGLGSTYYGNNMTKYYMWLTTILFRMLS